ncbi:putative DNA topoisomerase (ATP-hydrolyzing) [Helianthus annuus]|nr:putative DNA topoisomerase (ATP-hydrolyzing) [Helianthus annuus]
MVTSGAIISFPTMEGLIARIAGFRLTTRRAAMVEAHIYVISGTIAQWYFSKDDARVKQHTAFSKSEERLRILDAYRTGKGCVVVRGKTEIEISDSKTKSAAIVVKEIPYQNNKSSLVMKNAENKVSSFFIPIYVFIHAISFYVPL